MIPHYATPRKKCEWCKRRKVSLYTPLKLYAIRWSDTCRPKEIVREMLFFEAPYLCRKCRKHLEGSIYTACAQAKHRATKP